jgi:hypothetical protein
MSIVKRKPATEIATTDADVAGLSSTAAAMMERAREAGLKAERMHTLKAGEGFEGVYLGPGPSVEHAPNALGEVKQSATWRLEHASGVIVRLLGSYQLDRELSACTPGETVLIAHNGQRDVGGGKRVNDIVVFRDRDGVSAE